MTALRTAAAAVVLVLLTSCSGCSSVFYQPDRNMYYPPERAGFNPREVWFASGDGTRLHGWLFPALGIGARRPKGTVIQFHGNAENISSHYASLVWLTRQGYDLFTFDYRGYGKSEGEASPEGVYKDSLSALDVGYEAHRARRTGKFIVYGQSLGGAIAMRAMKDFRFAGETRLVVMDSTFLSYDTVARQTLAKFWLTWLFSPLGPLLVSDKYAPEQVVGTLKTPLLVIHDRRDPVVKFENGREIVDKYAGQKEFWELDQGRHIAIFSEPAGRERFVRYLDSR